MMQFAIGEEVLVKVGGSLGRWVSARVVSHGEDGACRVTGYSGEFPSSSIRRPRRSGSTGVATKAPSRPPRKRKETRIGYGPLRLDTYRQWVKTRPCIFCSGAADDPHHYGPKGMGQTTDDTRIVPVCRKAHDALHHRRPDELCAPTAYVRNDPHHAWSIIEAHIYRWQVNLLTEWVRYEGELR